jgi:NADPH:quinone reductase-like Zn-dependent oxidoreductase
VQLAKSAFGAGRVVVAGRDAARLEWLRSVGADDVIALRDEDLGARVKELHGERPFDAVLDYLWGQPGEQVLAALGSNELAAPYHHVRYVQIGAMAGLTMNLPAGLLRSAAITISGVGLGTMPPEVLGRVRAEALPKMFDMVVERQLQLEVQPHPLADVAEVWSTAVPSGTRVVLTP